MVEKIIFTCKLTLLYSSTNTSADTELKQHSEQHRDRVECLILP